MSLKAAIIEKNEGENVDFGEYTNLIMDEMTITGGEISKEDKDFLEKFTECQFLSLNQTGLKSLKNMPCLPKLERLELKDNVLKADDTCKTIVSLYPDLVTLKLTGNQLASEDSLKVLSGLTKLESLDVSENPLCAKVSSDKNEYQDKMRALLKIPSLYILDGHDKDGESLESEEEEAMDSEEDEGSELSGQEDEDEEEDGKDEAESESDGETDDTKLKRKKVAEAEESEDDELTA